MTMSYAQFAGLYPADDYATECTCEDRLDICQWHAEREALNIDPNCTCPTTTLGEPPDTDAECPVHGDDDE